MARAVVRQSGSVLQRYTSGLLGASVQPSRAYADAGGEPMTVALLVVSCHLCRVRPRRYRQRPGRLRCRYQGSAARHEDCVLCSLFVVRARFV